MDHPVLNLQLMRFVFDLKTLTKKKISNRVSFPDTLDMAPYVAGLSLPPCGCISVSPTLWTTFSAHPRSCTLAHINRSTLYTSALTHIAGVHMQTCKTHERTRTHTHTRARTHTHSKHYTNALTGIRALTHTQLPTHRCHPAHAVPAERCADPPRAERVLWALHCTRPPRAHGTVAAAERRRDKRAQGQEVPGYRGACACVCVCVCVCFLSHGLVKGGFGAGGTSIAAESRAWGKRGVLVCVCVCVWVCV